MATQPLEQQMTIEAPEPPKKKRGRKPKQTEAIVPAGATLPAPMELLKWAKANEIDVRDLGQVLDYALKYEAEMARRAWIDDMARLKADLPVILKTGHKQKSISKSSGAETADYWYAELDKACPVLIEALTKYNFTHRWETVSSTEKWIEIACVIQHRMGHSERTTLGGMPDTGPGRNAIQSVGSTQTYLERYTLFAALGIVAKGQDTDGVVMGIPAGTRAERCEWIANCRNMEELMRIWSDAMKEAGAVRDYDAQKLYMQAKDKRKDELIGGQL